MKKCICKKDFCEIKKGTDYFYEIYQFGERCNLKNNDINFNIYIDTFNEYFIDLKEQRMKKIKQLNEKMYMHKRN